MLRMLRVLTQLSSLLLLLPLAGCLASVSNYLYPRVEMAETKAAEVVAFLQTP